MKKLLGIFLAAVAMFAFGAVYWMNPLTQSFLRGPEDDVVAARQLSLAFNESGTYVVPRASGDPEKREELMKQGPVAMVHFKAEGFSGMDPKIMAVGFVHELLSLVIAAGVMGSLLSVLGTYTKRVVFMLSIGALMGFYSSLGNAIWWFNAVDFSVVVGLHTTLAWGIAGLVLAGFIKPGTSK